ncbi:MAG: alpha/beta fold hydrolase [Alphaproteobacteria bacterium]|nr:alpha/beta fold hydrolase [Alphaproteobacteria bacterium]
MKLHFNDFGEESQGNPVIVVLHGLFGSGRNWASFAKQFFATYRVLTVDLRNHGASPWDSEMTYPAMANDVIELIGAEGLEKPILLGHSMGGKVAMTAALSHPELLTGLILADIAPVTYSHSHAGLVDLMQALDVARYTRRSEADSDLAKSIDDPNLRGFLLHNLLFEEGGPRWQINLDVIPPSMPDLMRFPMEPGSCQFTGPVKLIAGSKSDFVLPEHHETVRDFFPATDIQMIDGAGHWVHAQKPEEFGAQVTPFLAALSP